MLKSPYLKDFSEVRSPIKNFKIFIFLFFRIREDMMRRGGFRSPGMGPMDPYLEAARRYSGGMHSPFARKYNFYTVNINLPVFGILL